MRLRAAYLLLQTALHVSGSDATHHQEHIQWRYPSSGAHTVTLPIIWSTYSDATHHQEHMQWRYPSSGAHTVTLPIIRSTYSDATHHQEHIQLHSQHLVLVAVSAEINKLNIVASLSIINWLRFAMQEHMNIRKLVQLLKSWIFVQSFPNCAPRMQRDTRPVPRGTVHTFV
jgi:hypothetical protein